MASRRPSILTDLLKCSNSSFITSYPRGLCTKSILRYGLCMLGKSQEVRMKSSNTLGPQTYMVASLLKNNKNDAKKHYPQCT